MALLAFVLAAVGANVLSPDGKADAAALLGCAETVPERSISIGPFDPISMDLQWDLGGIVGSSTIETTLLGLLVDANVDGILDPVLFDVDLDADGSSDGKFGLQYSNVAGFVNDSPAYGLLRDGYGLDYAPEVTNSGPLHLRFFVFLDDPGSWQAGTFGLDATLPFVDAEDLANEVENPTITHDVYKVRFDTTGADVSGSTTTSSPWPGGLGASVLLDSVVHDTLAVGVNTAANAFDNTIVPMSNLTLDVEIDRVADVDRDDHIRLGLTGPLANDGAGTVTSVGMPGQMAAAVVNVCDRLPQESFVGVSHNGTDPGLAIPATFEVDASIYGEGDVDGGGFDPDSERTLYVDATITEPPALLGVTLGADDLDVDGDGETDGYDLDGDLGAEGIPDDRLPWEYVAVHHDGSTEPDVDAVVAQRSVGGPEGELYVAASIDDLPADTSFDRAGVPTADTDGDDIPDDNNGDGVVDRGDIALNADVGAIAFCPKNWEVYPATCTTPPVAAGRIQVGYQPTIPDADPADGSLPVIYPEMSPAPYDLDETDEDHFPLTPTDGVVITAESTTIDDYLGPDVVTTDVTSAGLTITGAEEVAWDLRDDSEVTVRGNQLGTFGAEVTAEDLTDGTTGHIWAMLADAPDDLELSVDSAATERDDDPIEVSWDTGRSARTGAAVAVDAYLPDERRDIAASAWIGTGDGSEDGLFSNALLTVDLEDESNEIALGPRPLTGSYEPCIPFPCSPGPQPSLRLGPSNPTSEPLPPDPMAFEAGFTTRTEPQEAAGLALRGTVSAKVPHELALSWFDDGSTLVSGELSTCDREDPCPAKDIAATVVYDDWTGDVGHDALLGVEMIPVPDEDGREFPDFTELAGTGGYPLDWAHVVLHDDPHMMNSTPDLEEIDEGNKGGFDLRLAEVAKLKLGRSTTFHDLAGPPQRFQEVFNRLDACFEGATHEPADDATDPALGLGFYMDEYPDGQGEPAATWVDGTLSLQTTELLATLQTNTPAPDSGGVIGDLNAAQTEYAEASPNEANLIATTNFDCDEVEQGQARTLTGRVRRGTESSVGKILTLGAQSAAADSTGIPVPVAPGIDAALYTGEAGGTSYQALDAALRLDVSNVSVLQPRLRKCGVGNSPLEECHELDAYDATTSSEVFLAVTSINEGGLGDLDVEYLTEPSDKPDSPECVVSDLDPVDPRLNDECALRAAVHIDRLGATFRLEGTLEQRRRDGYLRADVTLNNSNLDLTGVEATFRDDYDSATLGAPGENGDTDQPLAWLVLQRVGRTLHIDSTVWAPVYGWKGAPYTSGDCRAGWPGAVRDSHFYPEGDKPSEWPTLGPRPTDTLRPAYVHGRIDLDPEGDGDPAETITVEVDSRVDQPGNYEGGFVKGEAIENWYDDDHRHATKVGLETDDVPTEGEVWGTFPGLQTHLHKNPTWGEFETCVDADMPLHLEWNDVSMVRGALDLLKATLTVPNAEKSAGGDATFRVEERLSADLLAADPRVATGIWANEIKTWLRGPLWPVNKDWASRAVTERMSVGMLDPGDLKVDLPPHDEVGIQSNFASGWDDAGLNGGRFYGSVLLQALFHESVEKEVAEDKGIQDTIDAWAGKDGFWTTIDATTESRLDAWALPELAPGTMVADGLFSHQTAHECVDVEKNAVHDDFEPSATTSDGSTFELAARWDNQRVQLYLIGKYSNGQVRFVRELFDGDPGPKACMLDLAGSFDIDDEDGTGRIELHLDLKVTAKQTPAADDWTIFNTDTFVFDASGNGWKDFTSTDEISVVDATAGKPAVLSGGGLEPVGFAECVWYPGDGTRITPGDEDIGKDSLTATHTYTFPGTYHVMQLCYYTITVEGQDPYWAVPREGTITVADPG